MEIVKKLKLLCLLILFLYTTSEACQPPPATLEYLEYNDTKIVLSKNNRYILKMEPSHWVEEKGNLIRKIEAIGTLFEIDESGSLKPLWKEKWLYPYKYEVRESGLSLDMKFYKILVSNDGTIVKINIYKNDNDKKHITTHKYGKIKKIYYYHEVGENKKLSVATCLGETLLKGNIYLMDNILHFETYDDIKWNINITTGKQYKEKH